MTFCFLLNSSWYQWRVIVEMQMSDLRRVRKRSEKLKFVYQNKFTLQGFYASRLDISFSCICNVSWNDECLFVCLLGISVPLEQFSLMLRRHHYRWGAANFDLFSALMTIEQLGFFSLSHLLWHATPTVTWDFRL